MVIFFIRYLFFVKNLECSPKVDPGVMRVYGIRAKTNHAAGIDLPVGDTGTTGNDHAVIISQVADEKISSAVDRGIAAGHQQGVVRGAQGSGHSDLRGVEDSSIGHDH